MEKSMKLRGMLVTGLCSVLALAGMARAETKVELKGVHLCCGACVKAANDILKQVDGVKGACDAKGKKITITATDDQAAQKALDALAAGGFHGDTGSKEVAIKDDSGATEGKVKKATVSGIHNCCGQCTGGIKRALKNVEGATANTLKPKETTFEVTGDFDAAELVKALNKAGFHVKVEK
jgi:mercuric ion binding protein